MGEIKISEMIEADSVNKDDLIMIVQNGLNKKVKAEKIGTGGNATGDTLPIGSIMPYPKTTSPENWLVCDGSAVSRTTYSELFNVIGEDFGAGDGSTTFNLPNIKGKTVVGLDTSDTDFNVIGKTIGEKTHKLTVDEMPSHTHGIGIEYTVVSGSDTPRLTSNPQNATCMTSATGNNQPHNNLQPSIVQNYIIKAKQSSGVVATVVDNLDSTSSTDALSANQGKNLNDKITGTVLFEAESGETGVSGTVTLSDVVSNYDYLEITYIDNVGAQATVKYIPEISEFVNLTIIAIDNATTLFIKNRQCVVSGNTIANKSNSINAEMSLTSTTQSVYQLENAIKIIKVVGYK